MNDICVNKHGHNPQSEAANQRLQPYKQNMKDRICDFICEQDTPQTCEDIVRCMGLKLQSVSARVSELKAEKRIEETGKPRNGYAQLVPWGMGGHECISDCRRIGCEAVQARTRQAELFQ
jgi:predicted Rossmann fold nucleotide-binding protein DprA/Smf involved in DNA uptake